MNRDERLPAFLVRRKPMLYAVAITSTDTKVIMHDELKINV